METKKQIQAEPAVRIRTARIEDAPALAAIYAPYVEKTAITFEYTPPAQEEFASRIRHTLERYPYLVAESEEGILGYAYAGAFHSRAAYDWAAEVSIYIRMDARRAGIGRQLYTALEAALKKQGILNANACIAYPEKEDAYLTKDSVRFHEKLGYRLVGQFHQCGYKFGRWYHMVWMEKLLGVHRSPPPPILPFRQVEPK